MNDKASQNDGGGRVYTKSTSISTLMKMFDAIAVVRPIEYSSNIQDANQNS